MAERYFDRFIFVSLCLLIFVLPATIAGVSIFSALAILFFLLKKVFVFQKAWQSACGPLRWKKAVSALVLPGYFPSRVFWTLMAFVAVCFLSIFWSVVPSLSVKAFFGKTLKVVIVFLAVQESVTTPKRKMWFLSCFLVSAFILCLDGLWQRIMGHDVFRHVVLGDGRVNASLNHPNDLGAYLILAIPCVLVVCFNWVSEKGKTTREKLFKYFLAAVASSIILAVMGLTFSRGAWVGLLCAAVVFVVLKRRAWLPVLVLTIGFLAIFHPLLAHHRDMTLINDTSSTQHSSFSTIGGDGRIQYWKDAWRIICDHPLWGTGLNTYTDVIKTYVQQNQNYAHNCYLQTAAELGIVGLVSFLCFIAAFFTAVYRNFVGLKGLRDQRILACLMAGMAGLLVESALDTTFYSVQLSVLMWLMMGLMGTFRQDVLEH
ncbi:MAG: O-antigen ligase family protein [Candidatus Omnitrophica bacterium]|nr:O-antigen ligase family protein [Candidatus Omnitrophota bacterium]